MSSSISSPDKGSGRRSNFVQRKSPPLNQFSLGSQSPQLRQTAAFNSIALKDRASGSGLDECFEVLRCSGKELMCEPYSRLGSHYSQVSILSHGLSHERLNKVKNTSVNFITPHLKSKEHSPKNNNAPQRLSREVIRVSSDGHKNTPVGSKPVTKSIASQITDFCSTKDICLQAELDDNYSSLTTHVMKKLPSGNDFVALRSINVALNNLLKVPDGLTKNL